MWLQFDPGQTIQEATEVQKYPFPTLDESLPKVSNAKICSCVDVYKGCMNIVLDESFCMPFGVCLGRKGISERQHEEFWKRRDCRGGRKGP